jgi:hypothetical protein
MMQRGRRHLLWRGLEGPLCFFRVQFISHGDSLAHPDLDFREGAMAKLFVLPVIRRQDYDAFRRDVGPNLATSYDEWARLLANEVAEARRIGKTVVEAEVNYDEFTRYCRTSGKKADPMTLLEFAMHRPLGEA